MNTDIAIVKCDEPGCGWSTQIEKRNVPEWHRQPCPRCGKGEIVDDEELLLFELLMGMERASDKIAGGDFTRIITEIDSAMMLKKEARHDH